MATAVRFDKTKAYSLLRTHAALKRETSLKRLFETDPDRAAQLSVRTEHAFLDFSRQRITPDVVQALTDLATELDLRGRIEAMFTGERINTTETSDDGSKGRAVLHTALRQQTDVPVLVGGHDVIPGVKTVLNRIRAFSEKVLSGEWQGVTGQPIRNIVTIGIGGSYLGPEYLAEACRVYAKKGMTLRFVANVDGTDFAQKTAGLNPAETLFIVVSKTFTTAETMKNAETAKTWLLNHFAVDKEVFSSKIDDREVIRRHFAAVSTAADKVAAFGVTDTDKMMFRFWDWVGGRYSATSAVGAVPLSLFLGYENFAEILRGANWMDEHFRTAPFAKNLPILLALIDIWNINFLGATSRAVLAYCQAMSRYAPHLQQLEMESNGKSVDIDGLPVEYATGEVVWGEPGTNGQHSFYQLLHQGTAVISADFIGFIEPQYPRGQASATEVTHHQELMTNFLAQPDALAFGQDNTNPAKVFPGNRPSSTLLLRKLTPFTAGLLLALAEHRTAVKGFLWGINSFDQFGVELGKKLGVDQRRRLLAYNADGSVDLAGLNPSTADLFTAIANGRLP